MDGDYQEVWDKGTQGSVIPLHGLKKGVPAPAEQPWPCPWSTSNLLNCRWQPGMATEDGSDLGDVVSIHVKSIRNNPGF